MIVDYTGIGQRIRVVRKKKKYTQEQLAEKLEVSIVYISQIENGKTKLSLEMLIKIAYILESDPGYFISGTLSDVRKNLTDDISFILENSSPKKLKLITEMIKLIDKY